MTARISLITVAMAAIAAGTLAEYQSAKRKALLIEEDRAPAHGAISFTLGEVNAYAAAEARREVPEGLRSPRIAFGDGSARGSALIDFAKIRSANGNPPGAVLGWLLRGEREVTVEVAVQSSAGTARVDVQRVTVGKAAISGRALELLIEYYVLPRYPEAAIGRPFALRHNVKQITVAPGGLTFAFGAGKK